MALDQNIDKQAYLKRIKEEMIEKTAAIAQVTPNRVASPYLSLSDMSIPDTLSDIFEWCKYFFMFDPLIHGAVNALATFPITPITLEETDEWVEKRKAATKENEEVYKKDSEFLTSLRYQLFHKVKIYKMLIEIGIDYFLYGNCFILGELKKNEATDEHEWSYIRRISPLNIKIDRYPDGRVKYKWIIPDYIRNVIKNKAPLDAYEKVPKIFVDAVNDNKSIVLDPDRLYHFSKPSDSLHETPWGLPGVANVLKLLMYRNTLRQAQEAIAREHIVPLRIFFLNPQNGMAPGAVAGSYGVGGQAIKSPNEILATEIAKASSDPNYKIVSSTPVGMITAGGHGRSLLLTAEIDQIQREILAGMNTPYEFIFGGVSYSGSSVSLKILENHFITYRLLLQDFINSFLIKEVAKARGIWHNEGDNGKLVVASFGELKMQDDIQQKQMAVNLNAAGKVSDDYLRRSFGIDSAKEISKITEEAIQKAMLNRSLMIEETKTQTILQKVAAIENMKLQEFVRKLNVYAQENGLDVINREDLMEIIDTIDLKFKTRTLETYEMQANQESERAVIKEEGEFMEMSATIVREAMNDSGYATQILLSAEAEFGNAQRFYELLTSVNEGIQEELKSAETEEELDNLAMFMGVLENLIVQYEKSLEKIMGTPVEPVQTDPTMVDEQTMMSPEEFDAQMMAQTPGMQPPLQDQPVQGQPMSGESQSGIDMRPMPTQLPPRRNTLG